MVSSNSGFLKQKLPVLFGWPFSKALKKKKKKRYFPVPCIVVRLNELMNRKHFECCLEEGKCSIKPEFSVIIIVMLPG